MSLDKYNRDSFYDADFAARSRLLVPHASAEARRDALIEAAVRIDDAVIALLEASRAACLADDEDYARAIDDARRAASALKAYQIVYGT